MASAPFTSTPPQLPPVSSLLFFVSLLVLLPSLALGQFPIPHSYPGIAFGPQPREAVAVLEAFFDLTCPSCRHGWPAVKEAVLSYGPRIRLVLHPFVLPFHHNSYLAARSIQTVAAINASLAFDWLDAVFDHQDEFSNDATWEVSPHQVVIRFAELAEAVLPGISAHRFLDSFGSPSVDVATRVTFKYGCLRSIIQTPSYFVNGVPVRDADDEWTLADWQRLLNPVVGGNGILHGAGVSGLVMNA